MSLTLASHLRNERSWLSRLGMHARHGSVTWLLCAVCLSSASCVEPGPSLVGQGQQYAAGDRRFDAFFSKVYAIQQELAGAPQKELASRKALAQALSEGEQSSSSALAKATRRRVQQLAQTGVYLRIDLEDDDEASARAEVAFSGRRPPESEQGFLTALATTARDELKLSLSMARIKRDIEELRFEATRLDKELDTAFRLSGPRKKAEVRTNLDDAVALMPIMTIRADDTHENADKMLRKLTDAARGDGPPGAVFAAHGDEPGAKAHAPSEDKKAAPRPTSAGHSKPAEAPQRPTRRAPARPTAPAPKPDKSAPAAAAPKPKPATTAADFEP